MCVSIHCNALHVHEKMEIRSRQPYCTPCPVQHTVLQVSPFGVHVNCNNEYDNDLYHAIGYVFNTTLT